MMLFLRIYNTIKWRFWRLCYKPFFKELGNKSFFISPIKLTPNSIICKSHVYVAHHGRIEGVLQYNSKKYNPLIILEEFVTIQQNCHLTCAKSIFIGKNTAIAANVTITDIHHPYVDIDLSIERQDIITSPVVIGEDCKIYNNTVILPGVTIGKHVTIGANSIVTRDLPDYSVAVGAPVKIVKRYCFEQERWRKTDEIGRFID